MAFDIFLKWNEKYQVIKGIYLDPLEMYIAYLLIEPVWQFCELASIISLSIISITKKISTRHDLIPSGLSLGHADVKIAYVICPL